MNCELQCFVLFVLILLLTQLFSYSVQAESADASQDFDPNKYLDVVYGEVQCDENNNVSTFLVNY